MLNCYGEAMSAPDPSATPSSETPFLPVLIVVATPQEAARLQGLPAQVAVSGVGAVAAALATWRALAQHPASRPAPRLVVSAGIGGAYPGSGLQSGDVAVSSAIVQADLGAQDGDCFLGLESLGLSVFPDRPQGASFAVWEGAAALAGRCGAAYGPLLTLNTVTGSHARAADLSRLFPGALTEGMEGAGVAHAAALAGVPVLEVRGVSNPVGPRDRAAWRIPEALAATRRVVAELLASAPG